MNPIRRAAIFIVLSLSVMQAQTYRVTNLGNLGDHWALPSAINAKGDVAGTSRLVSGNDHAFLWTQARGMQDLDAVSADITGAYGVNSSDQVVGSNSVSEHAFSWTQSGGMQDLGALGGCCSGAVAINEEAEVVGFALSASGVGTAFSWTPIGGMQALSTANGKFQDTLASAVNNKGFIVGSGSVVGSALTQHALLWTPNQSVEDLGTLGGLDSNAFGINALNLIVGSSLTSAGETHPFLWSRINGMQDLGLLSGFHACVATAINNQSEVVGTCFPLHPKDLPHAFVWTPSGGMQDLNNLVSGIVSGTLAEATAINSAGQIVVWAARNPYLNPSSALRLTPKP